ncbi:MAG: 4Fe-4S dicluster domain-containing protein [Candidatus Eisenbacteria bacterium]|uniref:4Fe-4S dicluster domain-containing protein n=1 Tax=Eiseniibacteriota bacterium TaxID=2212470 RepID=A0A948RY62_UNCEI|nr:4Fe-4S dicluster domain-containing protein [Candidatus Eisenbacteria bacterium]MBU1950897.1 4Fe-4S dicluster domain-containing protein [Candidatus Eisenbacteria bacterium]MBU2692131.1 4Fe-4S dicluster domain-containing protein [Candidatus Eisenbacteria bacterium]
MHAPGAEISREVLWNIKGTGFPIGPILMYSFAAITIFLFFRGLSRSGFFNRLKIAKLATGTDVDRTGNPWGRFWFTAADVFAHRRILKEPYQGLFHFFILWGFIALLITTTIVFLQADLIYPVWKVWFMKDAFYLGLSLFADLFGLLAITGVSMALARRLFFKPKWLDEKPEDNIILWSFLGILVTGFIVEGLRLQATEVNPANPMHAHIWTSPVGRMLAYLLSGMSLSAIYITHKILWWFHILGAFAFIVFIAYSKLFHMITTPVNIYLRARTAQPPIKTMPPESFEDAETFGIHNIEEYSRKDLFDSEACMRCGRCVEACPAFMTDKPLVPRDIIQDLRTYLEAKAKMVTGDDGIYKIVPDEAYKGPALIGDTIKKETIWSCVTCMACVEACPAYILQFPKLIDLRRYLVMMESDFPAGVADTFKGMESQSNPWGLGAHTRAEWADGLDVPLLSEKGEAEYLFYVGCAGALDDLNKKNAVAMVKILKAAGVDFAILGTEEGCCGDSAKKMGNEYLYQMLATANIEKFKEYKVKKIITLCPHGYNLLKHDYKELDGDYEVYHYTEILDTLIKEGKLALKNPIDHLGTITYHDSCYLGRYNNIYDQPRNILKALNSGPIVEMKDHHRKSFCCGAGGGRMWMEEDLGTRINHTRTKEVLDAGAKTVCTACPFCHTMLSDGIKELNLEEKLTAVDIAPLVAKAAGL